MSVEAAITYQMTVAFFCHLALCISNLCHSRAITVREWEREREEAGRECDSGKERERERIGSGRER